MSIIELKVELQSHVVRTVMTKCNAMRSALVNSLLIFYCLPVGSETLPSILLPNLTCSEAIRQEKSETAIKTCLKEVHSMQEQGVGSKILPTLLALSKLYASEGNYELSEQYLTKMYEHSEFNKDIESQYLWNRQVGLNHLHQHNYSLAHGYLHKAYVLADSIKNIEWLAKSSNDLGLIQYKQKRLESALKFYRESLGFKETIGNKYYIGTTLNNLGLLNKDIGDYEKSLDYYEQALSHFITYTQEDGFDVRVKSNISHLYEDLAVINSLLNNTQKKIHYLNKVLTTISEKRSEEEKLRAFINLATVRVDNNEVTKARLFLEQITTLLPNESNYFKDVALLRAKIAFKEMNFKLSKEQAKSVLRLANISYDAHLLSSTYKVLYEIAKAESDNQSTIDNLERYYFHKEKALSKRYQTDIGIIQEKIEKERYYRQTIEEKLINKSQKEEIKSLTHSLFYALLIIAIIILTTTFFMYVKRKEKQVLLDSIDSHREKLFLLQAETTNANGMEEPPKTDQGNFRAKLVDVMLDATALWEKSTHSNNIELAEKSKIWKVSIDSGRLRTRSLDKYLNLQKLPTNPRWKNVVRTGHFILSECNLSVEDRTQFNSKLDDLMSTVKKRSMRERLPE